MSLKQSFEKKGIFFFKYRGQIPLVLFVLAIPAVYFSDFDRIQSLNGGPRILLGLCIFISFLGQYIRSLAIGRSFKQTSGRNIWGHEALKLNTKGIYSVSRHPIYLGNFLMWMGIVLYTANVSFFIIVSLLFWLYYERIMFSEEVFLEEQFGDEFTTWAARTPPFFPSWKHYTKSEVAFSFKTILRREYPGVSAAIVSFVYVDFIRLWIQHGEVMWRWSHGIAVFIALLISFVLRTLKHHTNILREEDRS